ncbi:hypothetical protein [Variovorax sp.]|uniref:hypothetical protein n=1 Tax=Variovorax sp. TaxID=1871043 RepID=UPI003BAC2F88
MQSKLARDDLFRVVQIFVVFIHLGFLFLTAGFRSGDGSDFVGKLNKPAPYSAQTFLQEYSPKWDSHTASHRSSHGRTHREVEGALRQLEQLVLAPVQS